MKLYVGAWPEEILTASFLQVVTVQLLAYGNYVHSYTTVQLYILLPWLKECTSNNANSDELLPSKPDVFEENDFISNDSTFQSQVPTQLLYIYSQETDRQFVVWSPAKCGRLQLPESPTANNVRKETSSKKFMWNNPNGYYPSNIHLHLPLEFLKRALFTPIKVLTPFRDI